MMIVVTLSCCPAKLRGDLTRWLMEIDTGVFVGNLTARVRDSVWERICLNIGKGRATMVYSTNNEQKLAFRIHGASWEPVDYDGIKLVRRNFPKQDSEDDKKQSKAVIRHIAHMKAQASHREQMHRYAVIDLETTGLQDNDEIIEIGAAIIAEGAPLETYSALIRCERKLPQQIVSLTGITEEILQTDGILLKDAVEQLLSFLGNHEIIGYNIRFDLDFLQRACKQVGLPFIRNKQTDVQLYARKKLKQCRKYSMDAVAEFLCLPIERRHRALDDCLLTFRIFEKLKEI